MLTADLVARLHTDDLRISAWTPDTRHSMFRPLRRGVDSITTNRLDCLQRVLVGS
jgi:glycerophosphoryl diester phosphodiesterase